MSIKEVKDILNIGQNYAYELIKTDGFPKIKIGKRYFVPENALEKWMENYTYKEYFLPDSAKKSGSKSGSKKRRFAKIRID